MRSAKGGSSADRSFRRELRSVAKSWGSVSSNKSFVIQRSHPLARRGRSSPRPSHSHSTFLPGILSRRHRARQNSRNHKPPIKKLRPGELPGRSIIYSKARSLRHSIRKIREYLFHARYLIFPQDQKKEAGGQKQGTEKIGDRPEKTCDKPQISEPSQSEGENDGLNRLAFEIKHKAPVL